MKNLIFIFILVLVFAVGAFLFLSKKNPIPNTTKVETQKSSYVTINSKKISVKVVKTAEEKAKGLSGTAQLGEDEGMLFEFNPKTRVSFWMKDMLIPLDMIWIVNGKVVDIDKNVPVPEPGTPDARLETYYPDVDIEYVLEVNAGFSDENNIKVGDSVDFNLL